MKHVKASCIIAFLCLGMFCSCVNSVADQTPTVFLKRVVDVSNDGSSTTTVLNYDEDRISSIDADDAFLEFYYTGDLIAKTIRSDKSSQRKSTTSYIYVDDKLVRIESTDNYVINYSHDKEGSVYYEKIIKDSKNNAVKLYHGTLFFAKGNLVKDELTFDLGASKIVSNSSTSYTYDTKCNALKNILGFNKLLDYSKYTSVNNVLNTSVMSSIKNTTESQEISAIKMERIEYIYDDLEYPIEIVSENCIFGVKNGKHKKSLLFYK